MSGITYAKMITKGDNPDVMSFLANPLDHVISFLAGDTDRKYANVENLIRHPETTTPYSVKGTSANASKMEAQDILIQDVAARYFNNDVIHDGMFDRLKHLKDQWNEAVSVEQQSLTINQPPVAPVCPTWPEGVTRNADILMFQARLASYNTLLAQHKEMLKNRNPQLLLKNVFERFKEQLCIDVAANRSSFFSWATKVYKNYEEASVNEIIANPNHPAIFPSDNLVFRYKKAARFFEFTRSMRDLNLPNDVLDSVHAVSLRQQYLRIRARLPAGIRNDANSLSDDPGTTDADVTASLVRLERLCHKRTQNLSTTRVSIRSFEEIKAETTSIRGVQAREEDKRIEEAPRRPARRCFKCSDEDRSVSLCVHYCAECNNYARNHPCEHRKPIILRAKKRSKDDRDVNDKREEGRSNDRKQDFRDARDRKKRNRK